MRMATARSSGTWLASSLSERGLSLVGIGYASVRFALEQCATRAAGQSGRDLAAQLDRIPADRFHLVDCLLGVVAIVGALAGGWPVSTAVKHVAPMGGSAWSTLIPVGSTYKVLRSVPSLMVGVAEAAYGAVRPMYAGRVRGARLGVVQTPASCHVRRPSTWEAECVSLSILIVDDSGPFREVARRLLTREGLEVVGTASTSTEAVARVATLHPQVALVDINLAGESGFEVTRKLVESDLAPGPAVILTSTHAESEYADLIARSPAVGFVAKERLSAEAIRAVLSRATR